MRVMANLQNLLWRVRSWRQRREFLIQMTWLWIDLQTIPSVISDQLVTIDPRVLRRWRSNLRKQLKTRESCTRLSEILQLEMSFITPSFSDTKTS